MKNSLNYKIRPKKLKDIIGQKHLVDDLGILTRMVTTKKIFSLIFYGPPGIGKTSIVKALVNDLSISYDIFNASIDTKSKLMSIINNAKISKEYVIILEEIHRMNVDKQDILLSVLEQGNVYVFATTTENPYFILNPALRSRTTLLKLLPIDKNEMFSGINNILRKIKFNLEPEHIWQIVNNVNGDVRSAINVLDLLINLYGDVKITNNIMERVCSQSYIIASKDGDEFHNLKSAFHKSVRGSDVDASLYYLARLIKIGDLKTVIRRIKCIVYEDIGLANSALCMKVAIACDVAEQLGFPECNKVLANAVIEMCLSDKSNSADLAINNAINDVENGKIFDIPLHICDAHYKSARKLGIVGYKWPHNYANHWVDQQYMPDEIKDVKYYYVDLQNSNELKLNNSYEKRKNGFNLKK